MILRKRKLLYLTLISLLFFNAEIMTAQVTIGADSAPGKNAILQLKDKEPSQPGGITSTTGGLLLPRVELEKSKELLPFVEASVIGSSDYENVQKLTHTGLMVYNLKENKEEDLFVGVNMWDGAKWSTLDEKLSIAQGYVGSCDSVTFMGQYQNKVALSSANYMTIPMHITKPGTYTITAVPEPDNGYYFAASGVIMSAGYYYLTIPGAGSPNKPTPTNGVGDHIKITFNDVEVPCSKNLIIEDSSVKPLYTMSCADTKVTGLYKVNYELSSTNGNFIEMTLNVDPAAFGATYVIETNTVDGIYFKDQGVLSQVSQTIKLKGYGTPTNTNKKVLTITSNSKQTVATCEATVEITIPKKKLLAIGTYSAAYGYNFTYKNPYNLINNKMNFGTDLNSIVKFEGFEYIRPLGDFSPSSATALKTELDKKPDVVVIGVWWSPSADEATVLADYLAKGGVVLAYMEESGAQTFLRKIFADNGISGTSVNAAGAVYQFGYINDKIMNGPFGDLRGLQWGEDASTTFGLSGLPTGNIDIYSSDTDMSARNDGTGRITAFKHKTLNLIFVSDGGFNSSSTESAGNTLCPLNIGTKVINGITYPAYPLPKNNYGRGTTANRYPVYNSTFSANAFAWAIYQAEFHGINK